MLTYPNRFLQSYLSIWLIFVFITSVVFIPSIKGTTPAYLLSFVALPFIFLFSKHNSVKVFGILALTLGYFFFHNLISQIIVLFYQNDLPSFDKITLISNDSKVVFRKSLFTQSLYFFVSIIFFSVVAIFYSEDKHDRFIKIGLIILIIYGFYEIIFYQVFGYGGDFLTNRYFGEDASGSRFQTMSFGGYRFMRFKSLTGEPSMFAFSVLPYFMFFFHKRKMLFSIVLLVSIILSFSTSAVLGLGFYLIARLIIYGISNKANFYIGISIIIALVLFGGFFYEVIEELVIKKFSEQNYSGSVRMGNFRNHLAFFADSPVAIKLFGVGFGYVRSTDFFTTLLINIGIVGFILYSILFLYPVIFLRKSYENMGIKLGLLTTYMLIMIAVPEYAYFSIWLLLGIAYNKLIYKF